MPSERENMLAGKLYDPLDPELLSDGPEATFAAGNPCRVIREITE